MGACACGTRPRIQVTLQRASGRNEPPLLPLSSLPTSSRARKPCAAARAPPKPVHTRQPPVGAVHPPAPRRAQPRRARGAAPNRRSPTDARRTFEEPPGACRERARRVSQCRPANRSLGVCACPALRRPTPRRAQKSRAEPQAHPDARRTFEEPRGSPETDEERARGVLHSFETLSATSQLAPGTAGTPLNSVQGETLLG